VLNEPGRTRRPPRLHEAGGIVLEEHQVDLLRTLVEAHRAHPSEEFLALDAQRGIPELPVSHPGLGGQGLMVAPVDLDALAEVGLIRWHQREPNGVWLFSIPPRAIRYYADILQKQGQPTERVEQAVRRYIDAEGFKSRHPAAYAKWLQAEELLWGGDAQSQLTAIGHHCREAVQEFATVLVGQYQPPNCPADPASTVARLRAVLNVRRSSVDSTVHPFLEALLAYWGTVMDLLQRQEHGAQRERQSLTWEDGRRVVFQTLVVMYELDRTLSITSRSA
jgi:hypothetical protein